MQTKLIVLQPTSLCNLNCTYCYVPDRTISSRMSMALLERTFSLALSSELVQDQVEFLWHAGEPLTVGVPYYRGALELQERCNVREIEILNNVQTNATLVNEDWASFLSDHGFSVGVSLDGPPSIHDSQRLRWSGAGSHALAMRGVEILRSRGIQPGVICVLTRHSLRFPDEIFEFFIGNGFRSLGFNVEEVENVHLASSLEGANVVSEYRVFMERVFELWWPRRQEMSIREFDDFGHVFASYAADPSWSRPVLDTEPLGIITVRRNGDLSTFSPELAGVSSREIGSFTIGNIWKVSSLDDLASNPQFKIVAREAQASVDLCRASCEFFPVCGGEFLSNKFSEHGTLRSTETNTCKLHRKVLANFLLDRLAEEGPGTNHEWGV